MDISRLKAIPRRQSVIWLAALVLLAGAFWFGYAWIWPTKVKPDIVKTGSFVQTIVASGHVESPHRISISAQITATVAGIPVTEGQVVEQGQLLIALENSELNSTLLQAQASEQLAQSNLRQLRELKSPVAVQTQIQAEANFVNAKNNRARTLELFEQGFIGVAVRDEADRAYQIAQSQLTITEQQSNSYRPGGSDDALAQANVSQTHAQVHAATARLKYSTIESPRAGVLISRHVEVGDVVAPGKLLMTLSPKGPIQLILQIDEKNIKWLRVNQIALASADAFAEQKFQARLAYINPGIDPQRGSVEVKLDVQNPPAQLRQDMTVSVDIEVARIDNSVLIPLSSVHDIDSPTPWVYLIKDGVARKQPIGLGLVSQGFAQVLSGVRGADMVVPNPYSQVREGSRVRVLP